MIAGKKNCFQMVQQVKLPPSYRNAGPSGCCCISVPPSSLLTCLGKQWMMAHALGSVPTLQDTHMNFQVPGFYFSKPSVHHVGSGPLGVILLHLSNNYIFKNLPFSLDGKIMRFYVCACVSMPALRFSRVLGHMENMS